MKLYLIRHGQPELKEYSGFPGPKLSLYGQQQAKQISKILSNKKIEMVMSSDYTRTIETANPFLLSQPTTKFSKIVELREREIEIESHESLRNRVQSWFANNIVKITNVNTAIFGHCGSLNMILFYLDKNQTIMQYPYEDEYKCLTPISGIWELTFQNNRFIRGQLLHNGQVAV